MGDLPTSLLPWLVGFLVFGGMDTVSKVVLSESAFGIAFSKEQNCEVWKTVGATPLTRACLQNYNQVRQEMGDAKDAANNTRQLIQSTNDLSTFFLKEHGFDSDMLKTSIKTVKKQSGTLQHSQEQINAISQATTHNNVFYATGGGYLTD
jgi:hypothetical protein